MKIIIKYDSGGNNYCLHARVCEIKFVSLHRFIAWALGQNGLKTKNRMMTKFNYMEAKEDAMQLGLLTGCLWIASFALVVYNLPSVLAEIGYILGIASIPFVGLRLRKLRTLVCEMTLGRTLWVAWFTFMCAILLLTMAQYIYFAFLDNGRFVENILAMLSAKEVVDAYTEVGGAEMLEQVTESIKMLADTSVRELVMSFMTSNLMVGLGGSLVAALMTLGATYNPEKTSKQPENN